MTWTPDDKEIATLLNESTQRRYEYFLKRVCETRTVWGLFNDGWASLGDESGKFIPVWPHAVYAKQFAKGEWAGFAPKEIALDVFLERWIPGMGGEGIQPAIFPVDSGNAVIVSLEDLEANLRYELEPADGGAE